MLKYIQAMLFWGVEMDVMHDYWIEENMAVCHDP